jgi:uncharacterized protein YecE (DUF72 family)
MAACYFIGTSGWHYDHWRAIFYPRGVPKSRWLEFYSGQFNSVELNNTFYRLPTEEAVATWRDGVPAGFAFAAKASRYITHIKRLKGASDSVKAFLQRIASLADKLGPVLYQTPPSMRRDDSLLETFLAGLPRGHKAVFEFRHESWLEDPVFDILRRNGAGLCVFDMPDTACPVLATSGFAYFRFHGSAGLYSSSYTDTELAAWAEKIRRLAAGLEQVFVYFNNDVGGYALDNARTMRKYLDPAP